MYMRPHMEVFAQTRNSMESLDLQSDFNQDLMEDPVVASDGTSYERRAIEHWLQSLLGRTKHMRFKSCAC